MRCAWLRGVLDATVAPPHPLLGTSKGGTGRLRQVPPIRSIEDHAGAGPKAIGFHDLRLRKVEA